jgi:hypothetical protein
MNSFATDYFAYLCGLKNLMNITRNTENRCCTVEREECKGLSSLGVVSKLHRAKIIPCKRSAAQDSRDAMHRVFTASRLYCIVFKFPAGDTYQ